MAISPNGINATEDGGPDTGGKIKVTIYGQQTVRYSQDREMDKEDYEEYLRLCEEEPGEVDRTFEWLIETSDVGSADDIEDVEIIPAKVKP